MMPQSLEELLVERGLLRAAQVEKLARRAAKEKKTLAQLIRAGKLVYPEPLAQLTAQLLNVPYIDLSAAPVDPLAMQGISERAARTYQFVAFGISGQALQVALAAPDDFSAEQAVRFAASQRGLRAEIFCASPEAILAALNVREPSNAAQALKEFGQEFRRTSRQGPPKLRSALAWARAPVHKIVAVILRHAIDGLASDIHIEPNQKQTRVRYRIAGQLHTTLLLPADIHTALVSRLKILSSVLVSASDTPQEGRFTLRDEDQSYTIHSLFMPTIGGERVTLRLTDAAHPPPSFSELGMTQAQQALLAEHLHAHEGLVLVAGPGKAERSATLVTAVWEINTPDRAIVTLESPVEFEIPGVSQTSIKPAHGLSFAAGLASLLQQDVDVIMVSDLTDSETAAIALHGAQSGPLILSSLSASGVAQALAQLVALGINPFLIASVVRLIVAQRLVPKICQSCKVAAALPPELKEPLRAGLKELPRRGLASLDLPTKLTFYDSPGCPDCLEGRRPGTIALFEVVPMFRELRASLAGGADETSLASLIRRQGYHSLRQDGFIKALQGLVRLADVVRVTV